MPNIIRILILLSTPIAMKINIDKRTNRIYCLIVDKLVAYEFRQINIVQVGWAWMTSFYNLLLSNWASAADLIPSGFSLIRNGEYWSEQDSSAPITSSKIFISVCVRTVSVTPQLRSAARQNLMLPHDDQLGLQTYSTGYFFICLCC